MLKRFRVPGRLALKLMDLGVSVPAVLRKAGLLRDLFEQTISGIELRVLIDIAREETGAKGTERRESFILILGGPLRLPEFTRKRSETNLTATEHLARRVLMIYRCVCVSWM